MAELADLYDGLRDDVSGFVSGLEPDALDTPVPATPGWSIREIVAHLAADATCVIEGDFPREFFEAIGDDNAIGVLNDWTAGQVEERKDRPVEDLLQEWKSSGNEVSAMMRGEQPWPEGIFQFVDRVLLTDIAVHQQDIFCALGIERARESAAIGLAVRTYVAGMAWRLASAGLPPLRFEVPDESYTAGEGDPGATVRAKRFEFFRALSGRRSPEQIAAYDWQGDAQPYIPYFYPYGLRHEALVE